MQPPVIFLVGAPQAGKSTSRRLLESLTGLSGGSCSDVIYEFLAARRGVSLESLQQLPKESFRPDLVEAGDFMVGKLPSIAAAAPNSAIDDQIFRIPSMLIRNLFFRGKRVIDGVRRRVELAEAKSHIEWGGVRTLTIWLVRLGAPAIGDNTEDLSDLADETILNSGTEEQLRAKLHAALRKHFPAADAEFEERPSTDLVVPRKALVTASAAA